MANYKDLYEKQKDKQIADGFADLKGDIKEVRDEVKDFRKEFNSRLKTAEGEINVLKGEIFPPKKETVGQLPPIWRDPQLVRLAIYLVIFGIIVAVIYAGLKGLNLPKGLF